MFTRHRGILATLLAIVCLSFVTTAHALNRGGDDNDASKMIVGDSIFALSGDIHSNLEDDLGETIDTHARSGCQMIGGNIACSERYAIPNQYDDADKSGIDTVIMNGGGNDILFGDCDTAESCEETILAVEEEIASLTSQMQADGMEQIVFLGYYQTEGMEDIANYSMSLKQERYPSMGIDLVDPRDEFEGNLDRYITSDGIHPTAEGSRVLADLIIEELD